MIKQNDTYIKNLQIVDDNFFNIDVIHQIMSENWPSVNVSHCFSGEEAL